MSILSHDIKIKSDLSNNFFNIYNEARGIALNRNPILKKGINKSLNYLTSVLLFSIPIFLLSLIIIINNEYRFLVNYAYFVAIMDITVVLFIIFRIYVSYYYRKKDNFISYIIINKKGITDVSSFNNIELLFKWDRVDGIVIGKCSIVIFINKTIYLYFDIKDKKKIIDGIKKYKKDILIIE